MTPEFQLDLHRDEPPEVVWSRLWDLDRHTAFIPLTRVRSSDGGPLGLDARFTGRTGVGPLSLDDRMVVREWQPPRRAVIEKVGPAFRGTITVTLTADAGGTRVHWHQTYGAIGVPDGVARRLRPLLQTGYASSLRKILGDTAADER